MNPLPKKTLNINENETKKKGTDRLFFCFTVFMLFFFFTRIENKHGGGIPDLYATYNNKSAFLELKIKTKQNKLLISPLQISWNYKHFLQNPINYYLVNDPRRKVIELYNGDQGRELLENADGVGASLSFDRDNWHILTT